ncbi:MAG: DUF4382 domain-containing protein [Acidobacteria bacterium]|nr:DUF4382 domain-containing protein [Acidobacteriota bacterium]
MRQCAKVFGPLLLVALSQIFVTGCGSTSSSSGTGAPGGSPSSNVLINLSDDPGDQVVSFTLTIDSISLLPQGGGQPVTVLSAPAQVEVTKLAGTSLALGMATVPQGTYTGAEVVVSNPTVAILNADGSTTTQTLPPGPLTIEVTFDAPVTTGNSASAITFDLQVLGSIAIDANGNVTFTPDFRGNGGPAPSGAASPGQQAPTNSNLAHFQGTVTGKGVNSFTITLGTQNLIITVNSSTRYKGVKDLSSLSSGMVVAVDGGVQPDGSVLAVTVTVLKQPKKFTLDGTISIVTGNPATQLTVISRSSVGMDDAPEIGSKVKFNVAGAQYSIDNDDFSLAGLPFTPTFDSSNVFKGQLVQMSATATANPSAPPTLTASGVELQPQTVSGTPSNENGGTFTLTLPHDSAFARLTGAGTVTVITTNQTDIDGANGVSALTSHSRVMARGFMFFDQGQWKLVAIVVNVEK